jgi:uncharacterized protein YjbI with pentapeptide repeats
MAAPSPGGASRGSTNTARPRRVVLNLWKPAEDATTWWAVLKSRPSSRSGPSELREVVKSVAAQANLQAQDRLVLRVRDDTQLRLRELVTLIHLAGAPDLLDLSNCDMSYIRTSPESLSRPVDSLAPWKSASTGGLNLRGTTLQGAFFQHAELIGADLASAKLQDAQLTQSDFSGAVFSDADLTRASFQLSRLAGARFQSARLDEADFRGTDLRGTDLRSAISLRRAFWYRSELDRTGVARRQLGPKIGDEITASEDRKEETYYQAYEAYLSLKNNFVTLGRYEDASWAYIKEQLMKKCARYWGWQQRGPFVWTWHHREGEEHGHTGWGLFLGWLLSWLYYATTGYGERPSHTVVGAFVTIVLFACLYLTAGLASFLDALTYSFATFATFNLADENLQPNGLWANILSSSEAVLGIALLALLVFTLGNRMSKS